MRETSVEKRLRDQVKKHGGVTLKLAPFVAGTPDRLVLMPGGECALVELKAPGGRLRPIQRVQHERMAAIGHHVAVLNSVEKVDEWVAEHFPSL